MGNIGNLHTNSTWAETIEDLREEFRKWGIRDVQYPIFKDSREKVTLKFVPKGRQEWQAIECGKWPGQPERNVRAIFMAVQNTRLMDQRGIGAVLAQAVAHLALPSPKNYRSPQEILGLTPGMTPKQQVDRARQALAEAHPDTKDTGNHDKFIVVKQAAEKLGLV